MTFDQANAVAKFISERMDGRKLWSIDVGQCRKKKPEDEPNYRVVIEAAGSALPVAIYSARILAKPIVKEVVT